MIAAALAVGYILGSIPTADGLGRLWGVNLREDGSTNPGANNAFRLGGPLLAALVLLIELGKGSAAAVAGLLMADETGAVLAGIAAIAGNVLNIWYGFKGGKGLAIAGGVLLIIWPVMFLPTVFLIVLVAWMTRSSGTAVIVTLGVLNLAALSWMMFDWPVAWGVASDYLLVVFSVGTTSVLWRKHWTDSSIRKQRLL